MTGVDQNGCPVLVPKQGFDGGTSCLTQVSDARDMLSDETGDGSANDSGDASDSN
jgi:hypothetical protein